jgi:hypothetical protein
MSYPTQCFKVGGIHCLFLRCYKSGRTPILNVGPNWHFLPVLLGFATVASGYFIFMLEMLKSVTMLMKIWVYLLIAINLGFLFGGMLCNPGIEQSIFELKLK